MIFRLSQKLNAKVKAGTLSETPLDDNPFADWSCHLFVADRKQFVLLTNTKSLYSMVMFGKGIANQTQFVDAVLSNIREFLEDHGLATIYDKNIAPDSGTIRFAKSLNRSVISSMNDLILHGGDWLFEDGLPPNEIGFKLNDVPFSSLKYSNPQEAFKALAVDAESSR